MLQIAAHVDEVPPAELYAACAAAREIMSGEHAVGRVIARPFRGEPGAFERTEGRKDLALPPPGRSYMDELQAAGVPVHTVGKIGQVFDGVGVDVQHKGATNAAALAATADLIDTLDARVRLHQPRRDRPGLRAPQRRARAYHRALQAIDAEVGEWLPRLDPARDLLVHHRRPRLRPDHAGHRSHARARAAAGPLRRAWRQASRRAVRGRRRVRPAVAHRPRRALPGTPFL